MFGHQVRLLLRLSRQHRPLGDHDLWRRHRRNDVTGRRISRISGPHPWPQYLTGCGKRFCLRLAIDRLDNRLYTKCSINLCLRLFEICDVVLDLKHVLNYAKIFVRQLYSCYDEFNGYKTRIHSVSTTATSVITILTSNK